MKKRCTSILPLLLCVMLLFAFSSGISANDMKDFYADEESADGTSLFDGIILPDAGVSPLAEDGNLIIVLDPGHGGSDPGANPVKGRYESDHSIKVAQFCKAYLEQYDNVTVYLTHENKYDKNTAQMSLAERAAFAKEKNADMLISMHFNSATVTTLNGSEVYVSCLEEYKLDGLATAVLNNLGDLGLKKIGVKTRVSESGDLWYDETRLADYYGIIRGNCKQEIPSMIVEHCFINNEEEYEAFASTDEKLRALGEADAKAIVAYYGLDKNTDAAALEKQKDDAEKQLKAQYDAMNPDFYNAYYRTKIEEIYKDAVHRIEIATHSSKVDVTLYRALTTLQYYPTLPYTDVTVDHWFYDAVTFVTEEGLFYGTSEDTFSPNRPITRGEFITVIGRLSEAEVYYPAQSKFTDVDAEAYYAPYICWATKNNIVAGISETKFAPKDDIRREDLIRMVHNYCTVQKIELPVVSEKTIADFADGTQTDSWAVDDVNWAISVGLIQGYEDNTIRSTTSITRAEAAEIIMNFIESIPTK